MLFLVIPRPAGKNEGRRICPLFSRAACTANAIRQSTIAEAATSPLAAPGSRARPYSSTLWNHWHSNISSYTANPPRQSIVCSRDEDPSLGSRIQVPDYSTPWKTIGELCILNCTVIHQPKHHCQKFLEDPNPSTAKYSKAKGNP